MLTVEMTLMPASSSSFDVLPALGVARAGHVGVRELVDQRDRRLADEDGVEVHLLERRRRYSMRAAGDGLEVADLLGGAGPTVGLHEPDDDVGAALAAAAALVEHGEGLADAWGGAEVDAQCSSGHALSLPLLGLGEGEVELEDVHALLAQEPEDPLVGVPFDQIEHCRRSMPRARNPRSLQSCVGDGDVGVETGPRGGDGVDGHLARGEAVVAR